mgnify:CR=1 FL=1
MLNFQKAILTWAKTNFGAIAYKQEERVLRFLEEAVELCQALDLPKEKITHLVDVVYNKEKGPVAKELTDVQLNLYALAEHLKYPLQKESEEAFLYCLSRDQTFWRERQEKKYAAGTSTRP